MKKGFLFLLISLLGISSAFAQDFEFEMTRTQEVPGFFMVRIFPGINNIPLPIQNIFIANYEDKETDTYKDLLPFLREFGGKVVPADEVEKYSQNKNNRLIFIGGEEMKGFDYFRVQNPDKILEEFEAFATENLEPTLLQNVTAKFGGNVTEVFPTRIESIGFDDVFFVGKFEKAMKTRMEIQGVAAEGEIRAVAPLFLDDEELSRGPLAQELPAIWEELWKQSQDTEKSSLNWFSSFGVNDLFPVILLVLGIIILFVAIRKFVKRNKKLEEKLSIDENGIPSHSNWKDVPFEVEKKDS